MTAAATLHQVEPVNLGTTADDKPFVNTNEIKNAVAGREHEVLDALGIPAKWRDGKHIHCPYPVHDDIKPSWRWDADKVRAFCSCGGRSENIFGVVTRVEGIKFGAAMVRVAEILGRGDLIHRKNPGCELMAYATAKKLRIDFLASIGVREAIGKYGKPELEIPYRDEGGRLVTTRHRIRLTGKKHTLSDKGSKACLYGLDRLKDAIAADFAILVEGESDCHTLWLNGFPALGLPGAGTFNERRDGPMLSRIPLIYAIIEPDQAGEGLAAKLAKSAIADRVRLVRLGDGIKDPSELWLRCGADPEAFKVAFQAALDKAEPCPVIPKSAATPANDMPPSYVSFGPFQMTEKGLLYNSSEELEPIFLSQAFEVLAQTRDEGGSAWGLLLRWSDPDGKPHEWVMPRESLVGRGDGLWSALLRDGLNIATEAASRKKLANYLGAVRVNTRARSAAQIGWHLSGDGRLAFVLPDKTIGDTGEERIILQIENRPETFFNVSGSVSDWRNEIGSRCVGNSRLVMAASTALSGPLLNLVNEESGGFHLRGPSRIGKTVALRVSGSVWGGGGSDGIIRSWRATSNGLEGIAAAHSDGFLPLDEIGQVNPNDVGDAAYMLGNGTGKARANINGTARRSTRWRILFLSTGELSLADKMTEASKRTRAGQEVRLVDIPADAGAGMGLFENLHGAASPGEFAETLRKCAAQYYGTPIRAFLEALIERAAQDLDGLREQIVKSRLGFIAKHLPKDASPQVRSVCGRFALVAAGGGLATDFGLTGWPDDEAERCAGICFQAWLNHRGTAGDQETEAGIQQVIRFIEEHGSARFETTPESGLFVKTIDRVGFRRKMDDGNWQYMAYPEAWKSEISKGLDPHALARTMVNRGLIVPDSYNRAVKHVKIPGNGNPRLYVFAPDILERA